MRQGALDELFEIHERATEALEEDLDARVASVWSSLLLGYQDGSTPGDEGLPGEAAKAARGVGSAEDAVSLAYELASAHVDVGQLARSDWIAAWGLERFGTEARLNAPILWQLRAEIARNQGRWDDAATLLDEFEAALLPEEDLADLPPAFGAHQRGLRSRLLGMRAQRWMDLGVLDVAWEHLERADQLARASGDPEARAAQQLRQADWMIASEDFESLEGLVREAREEGAPAQILAVMEVHRGIAEGELELRDPERKRRAASMLERALQDPHLRASERFAGELASIELAWREGRFESARRYIESARALVPDTTSETSLQGRAFLRSLTGAVALDAGASSEDLHRALVDLKMAYTGLLAERARIPRRPGGIGFLHADPRRFILSTLVRMIIANDRELGIEEAIEHLLEVHSQGSLARTRVVEAPPSLEDVRNDLLGPGHGALIYLPASDRTHLFGIVRETALHFELPARHELRALALPLERALRVHPKRLAGRAERSAHASEIARLARRLGEALLPGGARSFLVDLSAITLSGDELLGSVPLEILPLAGDSLLGEDLAVDHQPSLALGVHLAREASPRRLDEVERALALFATLDPGPEALRRLGAQARVFKPADARRWTQFYDEEAVLTLANDACTGTAALERMGDLRDVPVVHLLAHGLYETGRERGAALALSPEPGRQSGLLYCEDIERGLRIGGVVLLSACGSARGPERLGDDNLAHLGGAFLQAGARCVVLTRSELELEDNLALMENVHGALASGATPAEALRRARKRSVDRVDPLTRFLLSDLQVVGLGQVPAFANGAGGR